MHCVYLLRVAAEEQDCRLKNCPVDPYSRFKHVFENFCDSNTIKCFSDNPFASALALLWLSKLRYG